MELCACGELFAVLLDGMIGELHPSCPAHIRPHLLMSSSSLTSRSQFHQTITIFLHQILCRLRERHCSVRESFFPLVGFSAFSNRFNLLFLRQESVLVGPIAALILFFFLQLDGFDSRGDVKELDDGKILLRVAHLYEVDTVTSIQRKTFGLALSIILTIRLPQVLDKLDQILSVCTSVILGGSEDLTEEESSNDHISSTRPHFPSKEFRKRQIKISDPVNQSSLENSVRENLQTCAALHGESFNSAISRMHPAAFDQLKQALKMT